MSYDTMRQKFSSYLTYM